ncbi:MAG TPA: secretin N-terminal domain-containing protein, partial [Azospira sp.]|nr:secretin N-terminal domain-containing protein [Azospira sp.]
MRLAIIVLGMLALTACTPPLSRSGETYDRISGELGAAAGSLPKSGAMSPANADSVTQALLPPLQIEAPRQAAAQLAPRFDLAVNNAPAQQVFMALVSGTRYSMLVGPEVSGNITVNLKDVTLREALDTIRELYGYEFQVKGTRIFIQPNTLQTRVFQINYLSSRRQGTSDVRVTSTSIAAVPSAGAGGGAAAAAVPAAAASGSPTSPSPAGTGSRIPDSSRVVTTSDSDFWRELSKALEAIVGSEGGRSVIVNPLSGVILVRALPGEVRYVESYLRATQVIVERQVMLEAKIIEVALSDDYQAGVNWSSFHNGRGSDVSLGVLGPNTTLRPRGASLISGDITAGAGASGLVTGSNTARFFGLAFQTGSFAALLNFLETQGNVQVLSSPRIATLNNQKAVLKVGTDEYFVTNVSTTTTTSASGNVTTPTITVQPFFSGIALDVTPQIDDEGNIILHVHPS